MPLFFVIFKRLCYYCLHMKNFCLKHKRLLIDIAVLLSVFVFVAASYFVFKPLYFKGATGLGSFDGVFNRFFTYGSILVLVGVGIFLKIKNKLTFETLIFLLFILGVILQLNYMLMTPYNYRQHDVVTDYMDGHEAYAWTLYTTGKLPTTVDSNGYLAYQFYHPPLNAFIQSIWMHICKGIMQMGNAITGKAIYDVNDMHTLFQTSEILSCFYMNVAIYFGIKIAYKLKIENKFKVFGVLFIALFPALILLAGQENNDPLCIVNCFIVLYFTICWWENHSYFNAVMIGLFTGLAMMAKLSGALVILPAIVAFIFVFIQLLRKKESVLHLILQGVIIALIASPLGLWFHIYVKIRFNQPFGFVFSNLNEGLYIGNHSFFARFINIFDFKDLTYSLWGNTFENYNLPNFLIKSAIFGEYSFIGGDPLAVFALLFHYLFTYLSLILMVIYFIKSGKEHLEVKIIAGTLIVTQLVAQLYFNIKMPYGCTMDFRYIVPIIVGFMILDALAVDKFSKENNWKKYFSYTVVIIGLLFIASTTAFYLVAF